MTISILGAGAWGTAIAISLSSEKDIVLWTHNSSTFSSIVEKRESNKLPGYFIPDNVSVKSDIEEAINSSLIIIATPTQSLREVCQRLNHYKVQKDIPIVITCKGIEKSTLMLTSEVVEDVLPDNPIAVFSGPSFAIEVAQKLPYSMVLACRNTSLGLKLISKLQHENVKLHFSEDVIGVQICAALKNVFSIACGIIFGRKLGYNAHAALITKSMDEIKTLYLAKTGNNNLDTLLGPSCLGDLVLTCTSFNSRNLSFGLRVGQSDEYDDIRQILSEDGLLIEGVSTVQSTFELTQKLGIKMPVCEAIYRLLYKGASVDDTISSLMS